MVLSPVCALSSAELLRTKRRSLPERGDSVVWSRGSLNERVPPGLLIGEDQEVPPTPVSLNWAIAGVTPQKALACSALELLRCSVARAWDVKAGFRATLWNRTPVL